MRGPIVGLVLSAAAVSPAAAADAATPTKAPAATATSSDSVWEATFNEETRYFSWHSTRGYPNTVTAPALPPTQPGSGWQLYVPVGLELVGRPNDDFKVELLTRSGYVRARQSTPGASGEVSTATDTSFTSKVTYLALDGVQPFMSLSVNVPTGRTVLLGNAAFARMDSDLVDIATFGEGWNIGPTVGVKVAPAENLLMIFGAGYTYRGPYDREGAIDPATLIQGTTRINPGDQITPNVTIGYQVGKLQLQGSASYVLETVTRLDGAPFYQAGDRMLANFAAGYDFTDSLSASFTGLFSHSGRNKVAMLGLSDLAVEGFNSNSNVFKAIIDITYKTGKLALGPTGGFLHRDHNAWSSTAFQFLPAKTRWSAGGVAGYAVSDAVTLNARVEHIWIGEADNPQKIAEDLLIPNTAVPAISSTGWLVSLGGVAKF